MRSARVRGFLSMSGGTVFAQIITLAALPFVSRLYSPADFGVLSIVLAISAIVTPAACLQFDAAVLLPRGKRDARAVTTAALLAVTIVALVWALLSDLVAGIIFSQRVPFLWLWVLLISWLTGLFTLFSQLAIRERRYGKVAARSIYQASTLAVAQVGFGLLQSGSFGLLASAVLSRLAGILGLARSSRWYLGRHRASDVRAVLRRYWRFPVVFAPSAVLNSLGLQLPVVFLAAVYGVQFAGQLGMAERIAAVPIALVGTAIGQVFIGEISELRRREEARYQRLFVRLSAILAATSIVGLGLLAVLSPALIPWILGDAWAEAGSLVQILSVMGMFRLVATPLSASISLFERARANVLIDLTRIALLGTAVAAILLTRPEPAHATILMYGALAVVYVITWIYVWWLLRRESTPEGSAV
ncbi:oligosaccharide flippase family protein [Microbacterium paraoxydans]|uniref:oligosaccharide flippase family protein n=1 Tax=Microbacterium paraoxydans TaxID=199592 RepID=UPI0030135B8F